MIRYSDELIDEIKSSNDIVDTISQYVTLKRSGRNFFGLCPFHKEKSPSFSVSPDKQIFHCFGCGVGGNVIHFVSKIENLDFRDTIEFLAERSGIELPKNEDEGFNQRQILKDKVYKINEEAANFYHENLYKPTSKQAQEYIKGRKLNNATLKSFMIGYSGKYNELYLYLKSKGFSEIEILESSLVNKNDRGQFIDRFRNRLMFPICDIRGKVIAFGGRVLDKSLPKYINSPENIVYSKGRNLFGMNVAKSSDLEKIIIVEGYMDAISLHQRGIHNVVASLGTALTEAQGRLLRKYAGKVIISYDSDAAGQAATMRGLEILKNLGCDIRILQMEGAKDPDEYVIKYGSGGFNLLVDNAISLVEFKVKVLKNQFNLDNTNDKIKFLKEIAKILSTVESQIELEIYIDNISKEYKISKESIYAEINKLKYDKSNSQKVEKKIVSRNIAKKSNVPEESVIRRENMIIYLLLNSDKDGANKLKNSIDISEIRYEVNQVILKAIYDYLEKGKELNNVLDEFKEDEIINQITKIMADDYEITDINKCIEDVINSYNKERLISKRNEILSKLDDKDNTKEEVANLEKELSEIIIKLAKMK
ncbi:MAG: DNA primase [Clostridia bacterium]|nr:DNA primase [Clostridia bacterium]